MSLTYAKVKKITKYVVGWSAGTVTYHVLKNNALRETRVQKVEFVIAGFVLASIVERHAEREIGRFMDDLAESWQKAKEKNEAQK